MLNRKLVERVSAFISQCGFLYATNLNFETILYVQDCMLQFRDVMSVHSPAASLLGQAERSNPATLTFLTGMRRLAFTNFLCLLAWTIFEPASRET